VVISPVLQLVSAIASIGRVAPASYYVSRSFGALALGTIAADFGIRYLVEAEADYLVGFFLFTVVTIRTILILIIPWLDREQTPRLVTCLVAFLICIGTSLWADLAKSAPLTLVTMLPFVGLTLGCFGEASNDMPTRRRYVLSIGCVMGLFAILTSAWGLLAKSLISDVGASLFYMTRPVLKKWRSEKVA
jgi:ABC-type proline/glycine betaine transport system permease subunit